MDQFPNYQIVEDYDITRLANTINLMVKEGWIPCGGCHKNGNGTIHQAMWKPPLPEYVIDTFNKVAAKASK